MRSAAKSPQLNQLENLIVVPRRDLAVEFANTLAWRGSTSEESLHNAGDVLSWLSVNQVMATAVIAELKTWLAEHPAQSVRLFDDAIEIREAIYRLLHAAASSSTPARGDLLRLNSALDDAAPRTLLERNANAFGWRIEAKPTASGILAPVIWSAADILVGPDSDRVRECANDRCLWLFLDDSKNGSRRWCSMQMCGNRAKAHRHYQRLKSE
jgi:predicted RNA-binding Zn ribbon-like protein